MVITNRPPSLRDYIKPGAKIKAVTMVIENPDGETLMVMPVEIKGSIDVITHWQGPPGASAFRQTGRLEMEFETMGVWQAQPAEPEPGQPGIRLPGMEYKVIER